MERFISIASSYSLSTLRAGADHSLCKQYYGRKDVCKYISISHRIMNNGNMLKIEYSNFLTMA
jgi:hypothetical protein